MEQDDARVAAARYQASRSRYVAAANALRALVEQLVDPAVAIDHVTARAKEIVSVEQKLARREDYEDISALTDLVGVRIVARYASDVGAICALLIREFDVQEDVIHGLENPEAFGYSSRHLVCRLREPRSLLPEWANFSDLVFEVQVRSILQHAWASISHGLDYKTGAEIPAPVRRQLFRVAALLETGDELFDEFRVAVSGVRQEYAEGVAARNWQNLSVDLDSLLAAEEEMPFTLLAKSAVEAGWRKRIKPVSADLNQENLGRLAQVGPRAGFRTLGALADYMKLLASDKTLLRAIAKAVPEGDAGPVAMGPDVAVMGVLASGLLPEADIEEIKFREPLLAALRRVRAERP
jgi:putative GTP pyrophosphokinase